MLLFPVSISLGIFISNSKIHSLAYGDKGVMEASGTVTMMYSSTSYDSNTILTANQFDMAIKPSIAYFFWQNIYLGANIGANYYWESFISNPGWYGSAGVYGGKTFNVKENIFLFAQIEVGEYLGGQSSSTYLGLNNPYVSLAGGAKLIIGSAVITSGLTYELDRYAGNFGSYWINSLRFSVGFGIYF